MELNVKIRNRSYERTIVTRSISKVIGVDGDIKLLNSYVRIGRDWDLERRMLLTRRVLRPRRMSAARYEPFQPNPMRRRVSLDERQPAQPVAYDHVFARQLQANVADVANVEEQMDVDMSHEENQLEANGEIDLEPDASTADPVLPASVNGTAPLVAEPQHMEVDANDLVNNGPTEVVAQSMDSVELEDKLLAINEDEYFANGDYENLYIDEDGLLADDDNANDLQPAAANVDPVWPASVNRTVAPPTEPQHMELDANDLVNHGPTDAEVVFPLNENGIVTVKNEADEINHGEAAIVPQKIRFRRLPYPFNVRGRRPSTECHHWETITEE